MSRNRKKTSKFTFALLLVSIVILVAAVAWLQRASYESGAAARAWMTEQPTRIQQTMEARLTLTPQ